MSKAPRPREKAAMNRRPGPFPRPMPERDRPSTAGGIGHGRGRKEPRRLLVESGARILERTMQGRTVALVLEIRSGGVPAFVERLKAIGEIRGSFPPGATVDGTVCCAWRS